MKLAAIRSEGHPLSEDQGQRQPEKFRGLLSQTACDSVMQEISVILGVEVRNVQISSYVGYPSDKSDDNNSSRFYRFDSFDSKNFRKN